MCRVQAQSVSHLELLGQRQQHEGELAALAQQEASPDGLLSADQGFQRQGFATSPNYGLWRDALLQERR